jgi:Uma2 family endonuclease
MPPMNEPHIGAVRNLAGLLFAQLGWQRTCSQTPIILPSDCEPEPAVAVFELGAPFKPHVDQVQLVIEVAQSTRRRDLGSKLEDYLRDAYASYGSSIWQSGAHLCIAAAGSWRATLTGPARC